MRKRTIATLRRLQEFCPKHKVTFEGGWYLVNSLGIGEADVIQSEARNRLREAIKEAVAPETEKISEVEAKINELQWKKSQLMYLRSMRMRRKTAKAFWAFKADS